MSFACDSLSNRLRFLCRVAGTKVFIERNIAVVPLGFYGRIEACRRGSRDIEVANPALTLLSDRVIRGRSRSIDHVRPAEYGHFPTYGQNAFNPVSLKVLAAITLQRD